MDTSCSFIISVSINATLQVGGIKWSIIKNNKALHDFLFKSKVELHLSILEYASLTGTNLSDAIIGHCNN